MKLETTIIAGDAPSGVAGAEWRIVSALVSPHRLQREASDARWTTSQVIATASGRPVGVVSMRRSRREGFGAPFLDPALVAPSLFGPPVPADSYLLVGGCAELVSGVAVAAHLDQEERSAVGGALVDAAFAYAEALGLRGAALYVRDEQLAYFTATQARGATKIDEFAELDVVGATDADYLASLNHGRRSVVRRDWQRLAALGLSGRAEPAAAVVADAAALVAAVNLRHHVPDHPRLAQMRLSRWASDPLGDRMAFTVRDHDGCLLSVSFGCHRGEVLELYELGLTEVHDARRLAYVEAMVYAPLRYARQAGCRRIHLGLGAHRPKDLRGARFAPVWAVGEERRNQDV